MLLSEFRELSPLANRFKGKPQVNIKFIAGGVFYAGSSNYSQSLLESDQFYVNPVPYMLRTWYDHTSPHKNRVNWTPSILGANFMTIDEMLEDIERDQVDVLCMSMYVWNTYTMIDIGKAVKARFPDIVILGGGPNAFAHREPDSFLSKWDFFDGIVYGDGEQVFSNLLDTMIDADSFKGDIFNLVFRTKDNRPVVTEHNRLKSNKFENISWINESRHIIIDEVKRIRNRYGFKVNICFNWEYARGCPYKCSFCDWNSGLHHKVSRRKNVSYREELRFLAKLSEKFGNIELYWTDANIGIYEEDVDIWKYVVDLEIEFKNFLGFYSPSMAKLHKQRVMEMWDYKAKRVKDKYELLEMQVSLQDINDQVLKNIDRPEIPWPEHKAMLSKLVEDNPNLKFFLQIIVGLPGQTLETMSENMQEYIDLENVNKLSEFQWSLLPNSPADSKEYQEKYQIKYAGFRRYYDYPPGATRREIMEQGKYNVDKLVVGSYSYTFPEYVGMLLMVFLFNSLSPVIVSGNKKIKNITKELMADVEFFRQLGEEYAKIFDDDMARYGEYGWLTEDDDGNGVDFSIPFRKTTQNKFRQELLERYKQKLIEQLNQASQ